ncbi:alpha-glucosidase domain-containing protein [Paradesertivirga mongoliensis]|uniref:Alpha-glucosidase domain-containing protein n=1 Tax=Paradesertivirga mongoliensis TaxID=2100740 RepID=A0ABW4ZKY9_9SPHI|nr:alpha-glucosidase domain-containing protein [Pedobacter mongoliensis]
MYKKIIYSFLLCLIFCGGVQVQAQNVVNISDGIIVNPKQGGATVRLRVISDRIIRVTADPEKDFRQSASLSVIDTLKRSGKWSASVFGNEAIVKTGAINAIVDLSTGRVRFLENKGNTILAEKETGRTFEPDSYDGDSFYKLTQVFESSQNEAFYGLGQHQEGIMNYKGRQVLLAQNNTEVAVPFVLSSRNYGILWDIIL